MPNYFGAHKKTMLCYKHNDFAKIDYLPVLSVLIKLSSL